MLDRDFVEILQCPACRAPLAYDEVKDQLKCGSCHRVYPVKDDIPVLLVDESHVEE
jgi:uncharacterized protein